MNLREPKKLWKDWKIVLKCGSDAKKRLRKWTYGSTKWRTNWESMNEKKRYDFKPPSLF